MSIERSPYYFVTYSATCDSGKEVLSQGAFCVGDFGDPNKIVIPIPDDILEKHQSQLTQLMLLLEAKETERQSDEQEIRIPG